MPQAVPGWIMICGVNISFHQAPDAPLSEVDESIHWMRRA
jgi:hypothetical protein